MKIFALQNIQNSGKTSTLRILDRLICEKYPDAQRDQLATGTFDIKVLLYPVNGLTIGIESQGDPSSRLQESLRDFESRGCDVVFCSCRTSGMTVEWIKGMCPPHTAEFVNQSRVETKDQDATNTKMAVHLMRLAGI